MFCLMVGAVFFALTLNDFYENGLPVIIKRFRLYTYEVKKMNVAQYLTLTGNPVIWQTREYIIRKSFKDIQYMSLKKGDNGTYIIEWLPSIKGATYYTCYLEAHDIVDMLNKSPEIFLEENKDY